jgi:hypothetical protein
MKKVGNAGFFCYIRGSKLSRFFLLIFRKIITFFCLHLEVSEKGVIFAAEM